MTEGVIAVELITEKRISINLRKLIAWLYALYGVRSVWLAFNSMDYSPVFYLLNQVIGYLCIPIGIFYLFIENNFKVKQKNLVLVSIPFTYWLMCVFHTYGGWELGNGVVTLIQITLFLLLDNKIKASIFEKFYKTIQLTNIISIVVWMCYQFKIPIGIETVKFYYGGFAVYEKWFIFAIYHHNSTWSTLADRLCGIFNEPGALGTICALLFIATFNSSKKWEKLLLLTTGCLTYSVAFFVLIFGYIILCFLKKGVKYSLITAIVCALFLQIPNMNFENPALNTLASRLKITETGFAGDNRLDDNYKAGYESMKETNDIYFGYGKDFSFSGNSSSYIKYIVQFGYIGFGIMILEWIIAAYFNIKNKDQLTYILFFFASLYQRPAPIISILGSILVFGGVAWMEYKNNIEKKIL